MKRQLGQARSPVEGGQQAIRSGDRARRNFDHPRRGVLGLVDARHAPTRSHASRAARWIRITRPVTPARSSPRWIARRTVLTSTESTSAAWSTRRTGGQLSRVSFGPGRRWPPSARGVAGCSIRRFCSPRIFGLAAHLVALPRTNQKILLLPQICQTCKRAWALKAQRFRPHPSPRSRLGNRAVREGRQGGCRYLAAKRPATPVGATDRSGTPERRAPRPGSRGLGNR